MGGYVYLRLRANDDQYRTANPHRPGLTQAPKPLRPATGPEQGRLNPCARRSGPARIKPRAARQPNEQRFSRSYPPAEVTSGARLTASPSRDKRARAAAFFACPPWTSSGRQRPQRSRSRIACDSGRVPSLGRCCRDSSGASVCGSTRETLASTPERSRATAFPDPCLAWKAGGAHGTLAGASARCPVVAE
jgi:hypothetical protein